jgi:hypothetical protein
LRYLIDCEFASPFDFFQAFGDYWEKQGWQRIGHQLEDLFTRLQQFLHERGVRRPDIADSLLKLDYYMQHKYRPRKTWWQPSLDKAQWNVLAERLAAAPAAVSPAFAALQLDEKTVHKHVMLERLPLDPTTWERTSGDVAAQPTVLIVYYPSDNDRPAQAFLVPEAALVAVIAPT